MDVVLYSSTSTTAFPVLVRSQTGEPIARINPDRTWSVKWPAVLDQAYQPLSEINVAICAVSQLLLAGRDNFRTSDWEHCQPWTNMQYDIGCAAANPSEAALALVGPSRVVAYVNGNAKWSIDWEQVDFIRAMEDSFWGLIPLAGFCELLIGAKDNFHTVPMLFHYH